MGIYQYEARTVSVVPKLQSLDTRSKSLFNSIDFSSHNTERFVKSLINFCSAAVIASTVPTSEPDVANFESVEYSYNVGRKAGADLTVKFYIDPYDTSLVLGKEMNGRLAIADNVFTLPEVTAYMTDIGYLAVDFTGSGTNPLQFIYDCCRVLHERATSDSTSYPNNDPQFSINISKRRNGVLCDINFNYIPLNAPNLPFYSKIADNYS
ncbi:hypothetical protein [Okeania sp. SIO2B9]|uniref:hypothetical protein n=1 Tax=Okeania sp. SIO2B9 TaxID=2607782 RepID=UPI00142A8FBA|nr:hypothetical protein [Okeania sp. SIO2B9]NES89280.1 hypothetical protein [Okeania sp. SIO2B9]